MEKRGREGGRMEKETGGKAYGVKEWREGGKEEIEKKRK